MENISQEEFWEKIEALVAEGWSEEEAYCYVSENFETEI